MKTTVEFLDEIGFKEFMAPKRQMEMAHNEELGFLQAPSVPDGYPLPQSLMVVPDGWASFRPPVFLVA